MTDYSEDATALFARFAERHRLVHSVESDAPIEVLWEFPEQHGLSFTITLGLQNGDELNFGVADFWSSFFPFEKSAATFEHALDAWVVGDARIVHVPLGGRALQLLIVDSGRRFTELTAFFRYPKTQSARFPTSQLYNPAERLLSTHVRTFAAKDSGTSGLTPGASTM